MTDSIPPGYLKNAAGHLVPEDQVRDHDKLRDDVASDLAKRAVDLHDQLQAFKKRALGDLSDLVSTAADKYGVEIGGKKGNLSITTFDGEYKVQRTVADRIEFTEEIHAAKAIFDECIRSWSEGANKNLRVLVDRAFRTDKKGKLNTSAILELLRIDIEDEEWLRGVEALKDSIHVSGTAVYVRIYRRVDGSDRYDAVPLDLAAV